MPELPEVETVARGVDARIGGERIERAWFSDKPEPFRTPPGEMARVLAGRRIDAVRRVGKHIVFDVSAHGAVGEQRDGESAAVQWLVHLGMTGRLLVSEASVPLPAHTHGILYLSSGRELRFVDARRFGRMGLHRPVTGEPAIAALAGPDGEGTRAATRSARARAASIGAGAAGFTGTGKEPLLIGAEEFRQLFRKRRTSIKAALLNQKLLQGVGNIYADESLFRAGIRPRKMAARLTARELYRLREALQHVLRTAIALGGSSVSDYVDADGVRGFFQLEHRVYMRTGQPCLLCAAPIRRIVLAGRGTHFCPRCQH